MSAELLGQLGAQLLPGERIFIFNAILLLQFGVWQVPQSTRSASLRGFVRQLVTLTVRQAVARGVPQDLLEGDDLENQTLANLFERWHRSAVPVREWLIREVAKLVRVRAYRAGLWLTAPLGPASRRRGSPQARKARRRSGTGTRRTFGTRKQKAAPEPG